MNTTFEESPAPEAAERLDCEGETLDAAVLCLECGEVTPEPADRCGGCGESL